MLFWNWQKYCYTNSIMITLKINMAAIKDCYSQALMIQCMELKLKMSMNILAKIKKCLILVIVLLR